VVRLIPIGPVQWLHTTSYNHCSRNYRLMLFRSSLSNNTPYGNAFDISRQTAADIELNGSSTYPIRNAPFLSQLHVSIAKVSRIPTPSIGLVVPKGDMFHMPPKSGVPAQEKTVLRKKIPANGRRRAQEARSHTHFTILLHNLRLLRRSPDGRPLSTPLLVPPTAAPSTTRARHRLAGT
jgi:hypothetical protein